MRRSIPAVETLHYYHVTGLHELHGEKYRGAGRLVALPPRTPETTYAGGTVAALNARPAIPIEAQQQVASDSAAAIADISA